MALTYQAAAAQAQMGDREVLLSFGTTTGALGGQVGFGVGVGVNGDGAGGGDVGDVYVGNYNNRRVEVFSRAGEFRRAFGYDVVASGPHDIGVGVETCYPEDVCKVGLNTGVAGTVGNAEGLGFDPATGNVFIADQQNRRIVVYGADGTFQGAFGWSVNASAPAAQLQFCTMATGCQQGASTAGAGGFTDLTSTGLAIDPDSGNLLVAERGNRRVNEFELTLDGDGRVTGVGFVRAFGWDVVSSGPGNRTVDRNERQSIRLAGPIDLGCFCSAPVTAGTFTLSFDPDAAGPAPSETTSAIPYDASAAVVEQHLVDDLASVAPGDIEISGGPGPGTAWTADFAGAYAGTDVAQITGSGAGLTPAGSNAIVSTTVAGGKFPAGLEVCVGADGDVCQAGTAGTGNGQFPASTPTDVAVDEDGAIYVASGAQVQVFNPDASFRETFGPTSGDCPINGTSVSGVEIDPDTQNVFVTQKPTTTSFRLCEFQPGGTLVDASPTNPVTTNATGYLYIARDGARTYVNTPVSSAQTAIHVIGETPPPPGVAIDPVGLGGIGATSATFEGTVTIPEAAVPVTTSYRFEYSSDGVTWRRAPIPDGIAGASPGDVEVSQAVGDLRPNTAYQVRLRASGPGGANTTSPVVFTTDPVPPTVVTTNVEDLQDSSARLRGVIDPHGLQTEFHFAYGTEPGDLTEITPIPNGDAGAANAAVAVMETVDSLVPNTTYYYQLVAISDAGVTEGPQRSFTTRSAPLASRGVELVSYPDDGGVGSTIRFLGKGVFFQVAPSGDAVMYHYAYGNESTTSPAMAKLVSRRGPSGWTTEQATPPLLEDTYPSDVQGFSGGEFIYAAEDLSCSLIASPQSLTSDASTIPRDNDLANLFVRYADGQYRLLTNDVPTNVATVAAPPQPPLSADQNGGFWAGGVSTDCERAVFEAPFRYPGVNSTADQSNWAIYKWEDGQLHHVSIRPDGTPAQSVRLGDATLTHGGPASRLHAVSDDGRRVYFTARSNSGSDSGQIALFLRDDDTTVKVSASATAVATQQVGYELAATDGGRVAFMANYGLTSPSSAGPTATGATCRSFPPRPCALYVYDVETESLTDISATADPANEIGAAVAGVVAASDDLQRVYFAAAGQLVAHEGKSYADNIGDGTLNVYLYDHGALAHVGVIAMGDIGSQKALLRSNGSGSSQATPDGRRLAFPSSLKLTPDASAGRPQVYLYDADTDELICVSCRRDGQPSITTSAFDVFSRDLPAEGAAPRLPRAMSDDGHRVLFKSMDALAPGAVDGKTNVYVWDRGAIQFLTTGALTPSGGGGEQPEPRVVGMSASGGDVFVTTPESLVPEDGDGMPDLYDFRVGGGFSSGPTPEGPCDPLAAQCQSGGGPSLESEVHSRSDGRGNAVAPARARVRLAQLGAGQRAALAAGRRVGLRVRVNRSGRVVVRGTARVGGRRRAVLVGSKAARGSGTVRVALRLSRPARRALKRSGSLRVALSVRLAGSPRPVNATVVLKRKPLRSAGRSDVGGRR